MMPALFAFAVAVSAPECLQPSGSRITAADIAAIVPEYGKLPADLVLGYAPQPGASRVLAGSELSQWLARHGVQADLQTSVCFRWNLKPLDLEQATAAMLRSLPEGSTVRISDANAYGVPTGELVFPLSSLQVRQGNDLPLWKGYVRYAEGQKYEVWARVELRVPFQRVVAAQDIQGGAVIEASMVRVETGEGLPQSAETFAEPEQVVGRTARRLIRQGAQVASSSLDKPAAVRKGETVHVSVINGSARIGTQAVAEANAAPGEFVPIRVADTGKLLRAQIVATGQAIVDLSGPGSSGIRSSVR